MCKIPAVRSIFNLATILKAKGQIHVSVRLTSMPFICRKHLLRLKYPFHSVWKKLHKQIFTMLLCFIM